MFRFLTAIACVVILPVYGFSLYAQLSQVLNLGGNVFWFLCGALMLGIFYLLARPSFILLVLLHELNHAIVGWLMGARIRSLEASDTAGGAVKYDFEYAWGQEVISLAPYFFQPIPLVLSVIKAMIRSAFDPLICFAMGATWAWFYFDLGTTFQAPQLDITFQRAQKLDPEYAGTYVGFALIEATAGKFQEALRYLETARKKDKRGIDVYLAQGRIQVMQAKQDWLKHALEIYAEARKLGNRDDRVAFYEGDAYRKAGQYQDAENAYSRAIDLEGPMQARSARALSEVQMTRRAAPGTQVGLRVAELDPLTRANLCALLIDELKVDELVEKQREKTYDTGFQSPGDQTQDEAGKGPGDIEGHWAKAWVEQTLGLDLPGLGLRSDGLFVPDDAVKRKDLAQVLQGLLVLITKDESLVTKYVGSESRFPDVRSDIYDYNAAALAVDRGLMRVDTREGTFRPEGTPCPGRKPCWRSRT